MSAPLHHVAVTLASLSDWKKWVDERLDLPAGMVYRDEPHRYFVLLHQVYPPDNDAVRRGGLLCDVRQENRPMLVPLHQLHADPPDPVLEAYRAWRIAAVDGSG